MEQREARSKSDWNLRRQIKNSYLSAKHVKGCLRLSLRVRVRMRVRMRMCVCVLGAHVPKFVIKLLLSIIKQVFICPIIKQVVSFHLLKGN